MNVKEIQLMLDSVDEEAELSHTWTRPAGELIIKEDLSQLCSLSRMELR